MIELSTHDADEFFLRQPQLPKYMKPELRRSGTELWHS